MAMPESPAPLPTTTMSNSFLLLLMLLLVLYVFTQGAIWVVDHKTIIISTEFLVLGACLFTGNMQKLILCPAVRIL
jgi:hypothetical protein